MRNTDILFEKLFKKAVSSAQNAEYLTEVCNKYPFFSTAQFFLLKQTNRQSGVYDQQVGKAAVFFNNPYWLNFQLNVEDTTADEAIPVAMEDPLAADNTDLPASVTETDDMKIELKLPEINTTADTISFEPLHTSDYFASQGIKLSEQVLPTDKLGMQLKSFTQWLKTMKKIHTELVPEDAQTDSTIQKLADKSNAADETLTEAMAEVLLQQGKKNKAIEVYNKLSLLNPSKSAYFAAKIEQLKG